MVKGKTRGTKKEKEQENAQVIKGKAWFENHRTTLWEISLILLGLVLGVGGSILWTGNQNYQDDTSVAHSLYNEINASNNPVNIWAPILIEGVPPEPVIENSLIPNTSVFPSINDKIQRFDKKLRQNIISYYSNLSEAEHYRLKLEEVRKNGSEANATDSSYDQVYLYLEKDYFISMKSKLLNCYHQISIIKNQIKQNFKI